MTPPDLLARLRGERGKHRDHRRNAEHDVSECPAGCLRTVPCETARALDCAIALAQSVQAVIDVLRDGSGNVSLAAIEADWEYIARAYEGKNAEE